MASEQTFASESESIEPGNVNETGSVIDNEEDELNRASTAKPKPPTDGAGGGDADDLDAWVKSRQLVKPDNQLDLTEAELSEEITKVLTTTNTNVVHNLVVYSFKEEAYVPLPPAGNTVTLLKFDGNSLHIDSDEAKYQMEESGEIGYPLPAPRYSLMEAEAAPPKTDDGEAGEGGEGEDQEGKEGEEGAEEAEGEEEAEEEAAEEGGEAEEGEKIEEETADAAPAAAAAGGKKRKLINQFNFCERAALTFTNPTRNVDTQTIPPPRSQYGANVLQWVIYDSYAEDFEQQQKERDKKDDKKAQRKDELKMSKQELKAAQAEELNKKYLKCWQILERMINQNIYKDIAHDYRYWEDPADEFRDGEGTLLPLWKFQYERTKKMSVTDVMFNPYYYDLFAVCFGSHDFMKQPSEGSICLFTVKNPSYPDYIIMTESGVMCCDIHPKYPFLVAIGLYDGNVHVYNLKENYREPLYVSMGVGDKHIECVWEIKWGPDMADGEINFYSVSSGGRVFNWVLMQNKLMVTTIITLFLENGIVSGPDGTELRLRSCGSCMKFHPEDPEIFLVGTEEGCIYKCSIAYSSKYLMTYRAHNLSVYRIDFNRFNSNIFISCSGDWRVKIWEDMRSEPLFIFDLGSAVGDVKWAPYSSTVFAAVTNEGKVYVFDLNVNKYKAICIQAVVPKRKNKLTRLSFNEKLPFIIVGDDKGTVTSLKLSPNLRQMVKPPKKQQNLEQSVLQVQKLEKLLSLVRELPEGEIIKDTTTTVQS
ncbi:dynein intermediate chain 2, ciliary-like isoform X2 [Musca domestica]|uniref:Dynein intermediate chain 2, ciliary-like isoform X2 n=1 Tax=Musca domestica TaxID=7370 RepID=A0ABM3USQ9_MUSDO|nr:dynein intermediate chain 2, ciliary-like isoform X2 [Musca domestica]